LLLLPLLLLLLLLRACLQVNAATFSCGQPAALYRNRSCSSRADTESEWYVAADAKLTHRMINITWFSNHGMQDVLAGAVGLAAAAAATAVAAAAAGQRRSGSSGSRQRTVNGKRSAAGMLRHLALCCCLLLAVVLCICNFQQIEV
jgi:hypothetical protein